MGIGRREFLLQFGAAITTLASLGRAAAFVEDLYVDRRHGIAFRRPAGWTYESLAEATRTKSGMLLDFAGFDPERWAEFIQQDEKYAAFVVVGDMARSQPMPGWKGGAEPDVIAPGISVQFEGTWAEDGPYPRGQPVSIPAFVERDLKNFSRAYANYRLLQVPAPRRISGCDAVEYLASYGYKHRQVAGAIPMRERVLYIHQDPAIYSVRMWDYPELRPALEYSFDSFIPTIQVL